MKTTQTHARYVEWLSPEEMHKNSQEWLSELAFLKDEHFFFEDLVKLYTLRLIAVEKFAHNKEIIDAINRSEKQNNSLLKEVKEHEKELQIMVDGKDQPKEEDAYKKEHRRLIIEISAYLKNYRILKTQLFNIIKKIKKEDKQQHLLDRK